MDKRLSVLQCSKLVINAFYVRIDVKVHIELLEFWGVSVEVLGTVTKYNDVLSERNVAQRYGKPGFVHSSPRLS